MKPFALYCKSYHTDLRRVVRLVHSVREFNRDHLPFHLSVPRSELALFSEHLAGLDVELHADEDILRTIPNTNLEQIHRLVGSVSQQIVKSSFWRLNISQSYICLDSDSFFIRPFGLSDFVTSDGTPYTVLDEAHDLLEAAMQHQKDRIVESFQMEARKVQQLFGRAGRTYSFGPFPLVWHRAVWESLDTQYLNPKGMSFVDAIALAPIESRWYGEALLNFKAVSLLPCQALFKVYHYAWQLDQDNKLGMTPEKLSQLYCGIIYQSAWEREMDWPEEGGSFWSRTGRRIRRKLGRI